MGEKMDAIFEELRRLERHDRMPTLVRLSESAARGLRREAGHPDGGPVVPRGTVFGVPYIVRPDVEVESESTHPDPVGRALGVPPRSGAE